MYIYIYIYVCVCIAMHVYACLSVLLGQKKKKPRAKAKAGKKKDSGRKKSAAKDKKKKKTDNKKKKSSKKGGRKKAAENDLDSLAGLMQEPAHQFIICCLGLGLTSGSSYDIPGRMPRTCLQGIPRLSYIRLREVNARKMQNLSCNRSKSMTQ